MKSILSLNARLLVFALAIVTCLVSCDDDDPPLPDNIINFESQQLGIDSDENSATIHISFSREANNESQITVSAQLDGLTYDTDFTTDPAINGSTLTIPVAVGATQVSFTVSKAADVVLDGNETIKFTITSAGSGLVVGDRPEIVVSFSEIIATQATMDPNVGGALQPNKVFVDLSANRQTVVNRGDWDLAFYTEDDQFRVILNSSSSMLARALDANDLNDVTAADTVEWGTQLSTDGIFGAITQDPVPAWVSEASQWIDAPSGDMSTTAIAEISATDSDNKVYIVNRGKNPDGTQRGWKKIRIIRNGQNYTLQHADIDATTFASVDVTRNDDYLFNYVNFETGALTIEPEKDKWDIAFTVFTNTTPIGPGASVPYVFNDVVIQNRYEVETAEVLISDVGSYEDFTAADLGSATFSASQINIGSKWRSGGGPGSGPALREDRFYIIKDADDNIYKLKFTALTQGGERGRPQIQFELLQEDAD